MRIEQVDIAGLSDSDLKRMVLVLADEDWPSTGIGDFYRRVAAALVRVVRERRLLVADLEYDLMNDDDIGAIVEAGSDPIAEALEEMRDGIRRMRGIE